MTRSIEEALNLPPIKEALEKNKTETTESISAPVETFIKDPCAFAEYTHSKEMDDIIRQATEAHKSILDLGFNVEAKAAGTIFSQAASHLDIALKAAKSKADFRLKIQELALEDKKTSLENGLTDENAVIVSEGGGSSYEASRNDLILKMREQIKQIQEEAIVEEVIIEEVIKDPSK